MDQPPYSLIFSKITSQEAADAFSFHVQIAGGDHHLWPRSQQQINAMAEEGLLFGVRRSDTGAYVGLCYIMLAEEDDVWEFGGLTVPEEYRGKGIGLFLVRFALSHNIAWEQPFQNNQQIIAHVHVENPAPRGVLSKAGFVQQSGTIKIPGDVAPPTMKRNKDGEVEGNVFVLDASAVVSLVQWLDGFRGRMEDGQPVEIRLGANQVLEDLRIALRETQKELERGKAKTKLRLRQDQG